MKPFLRLVDMATQSRNHAQPLPRQELVVEQFTGVAFTLFGQSLVASMDEVAELLRVPTLTRLPGVQSWVNGVANLRGRLLPVIDLERFFGHNCALPIKRRRLLVVDKEPIYVGFLVEEVFGMQHFDVTSLGPATVTDDVLLPFVSGSYQLNGRRWSIFSFDKLIENENFLRVASTA